MTDLREQTAVVHADGTGERLVAVARACLGSAAFTTAWAEGRAVAFDGLIADVSDR